MSLLAFHDVHALYGHARILNGVTFAVNAGERVALVGRNGVGKTTVVNTLSGVTRIAHGDIDVRGQTLARLRGYTAAQNGIAIVLQGRGIVQHLTVEERSCSLARRQSATDLGRCRASTNCSRSCASGAPIPVWRCPAGSNKCSQSGAR